MGRLLLAFGAAAAFVVGCASGANAQYFGRNKVHYDHSEVRVLATEHFDLYYPSEDLSAALAAGRLAERWYVRLSKTLQHTLKGRQPLILYASHRTFEQTNVWSGLIDERTGGFTESRKRRIVIPFASTLAETDHVLGHEIVHAFQYDIADEAKSPLDVPLWFIEGMAEYLSLGSDDRLTAMWMRDAAAREHLPKIADLTSPKYFPYRWGAAVWSFLAQQYGTDLPARALRAKRDVRRRLESVTGQSMDSITRQWHRFIRDTYGTTSAASNPSSAIISTAHGGGRLNLAAALSPDGRRMIYFSERDQLSVDLFLADARNGTVLRKLITTAANPGFDSLQYLHSAGVWDSAGRRFVLATIRDGRPTLVLLDVDGTAPPREVKLAQFDEVYSPTWSPDGDDIAFAALTGGTTDLFIVNLSTERVRRLTNDQFADVQPAWSPDGRTIAFATDRFSTSLSDQRWGSLQVAFIDVESGAISAMGAANVAAQRDPAWSPDGSSVFFVGDLRDISNVFRFERTTGREFQLTDVRTGVSGVTRLSPALSVAAHSGTVAYSVFQQGGYEIRTIEPGAVLSENELTLAQAGSPEIGSGRDLDNSPVPNLPRIVDRVSAADVRKYRPRLGLEAFGMPYFSAGGGAFGGSVQGGVSFLLGDLLGDRQMFTAVHVSSQLDESAFSTTYLDRGSRWNWGFTFAQVPEVGYSLSPITPGGDGTETLVRTRERQVWTERTLSAFVAYPLNRWRRLEFSLGARQNLFESQSEMDVVSTVTKRLVETRPVDEPQMQPLTVAGVSAAFVGDTAVWGGTGPILGSRYRVQLSPVVGGVSYVDVLADYRRYLMPFKPYTIALRVLDSARFGPGSNDPRLLDTYIGSSWLVRGYNASRITGSRCTTDAICPALNNLLGTGVLVAKLEVRAPLLSVFRSRLHYGTVPLDVFGFADAGTTWGGAGGPFTFDTIFQALIRSVGGGIRANVMGMVFDLAAEHPLDLHQQGWRFAVNLRPGF